MKKFNCFVVLTIFSLIFPNFVISNQENSISLTEKEQNWLKQEHTVRVRVGNWPPFMFSEGDFKGISLDYIKTIFDGHGIKYQFVTDKQVPWKMALEQIKNHQAVDLILTAKITEERKKDMLFTDEYLFLPWVIFSRNDSPFIGGIEDLAGKTVSVPSGYVMHDLLKQNYPEIKLKVISGNDLAPRCIKALAQGTVDAYIGNLAVGSYTIQTKGYTNLKVAAPTPFGTHDQAMAVRDDWAELVTIINKSLGNFTAEQHSEIRNKWLSIRYEHGIRAMDIVKWVLGVASILIITLMLVLLWNRTLNKEILERKKVEQKLQDSEDRYRSLSDAAFEGILIIEKGVILEVNNTIARIFGYKAEEVINMNVSDFIMADYRKDVQNKILSGYEKPYETVALKKDGSNFPIEVHAKMFEYQNRTVRVAAIRDLTEQKKAVEEIKALRGILPLCSFCKKIRDDEGYWEKVDVYIHKYSEADISHGICPDCIKKHYPEEYKSLFDKKSE